MGTHRDARRLRQRKRAPAPGVHFRARIVLPRRASVAMRERHATSNSGSRTQPPPRRSSKRREDASGVPRRSLQCAQHARRASCSPAAESTTCSELEFRSAGMCSVLAQAGHRLGPSAHPSLTASRWRGARRAASGALDLRCPGRPRTASDIALEEMGSF